MAFEAGLCWHWYAGHRIGQSIRADGRTVREVASGARYAVLAVIDEIPGDCSRPIIEFRSREDGHVTLVAVRDTSGRGGNSHGRFLPLNIGVLLTVLRDGVLTVDLHTLEVFPENEIHDTRNRVRPINCGGATGYDFHTLDHRDGYLIKIRRRIEIAGIGIANSQAPTVYEYHGALWTEAAQIRRR